jgi:formylglycine-generating enzyme required for sulfatase activity
VRAVILIGLALICAACQRRASDEPCPAGMVLIRAQGRLEKDFCMGPTEVTVAQYRRCVQAGKCAPAPTTVSKSDIPEDLSPFCNGDRATKNDHPVNCIDWNMARAYCTWIGGRLPSSAEWIHAAGGSDGRVYPWGNAEPDAQLCWRRQTAHVKDDSQPGTCAVGQFPAGRSPYGLLDMAGNVFEWTSSRAGPDGGQRFFHGGTWWADRPLFLKISLRGAHYPNLRLADLGVRCAAELR